VISHPFGWGRSEHVFQAFRSFSRRQFFLSARRSFLVGRIPKEELSPHLVFPSMYGLFPIPVGTAEKYESFFAQFFNQAGPLFALRSHFTQTPFSADGFKLSHRFWFQCFFF